MTEAVGYTYLGALLTVVAFVAGLALATPPVEYLAAILFIVAWGLIDVHHIRNILRTSRRESAVLLITFLGTVATNRRPAGS